MTRVKLPAGIESVSGKIGDVCFRTMNASGRVYMYRMKSHGGKVQCAKEPSERDKARRERFTKLAEMVRYMRKNGSKLSAKELWKIAAQVL